MWKRYYETFDVSDGYKITFVTPGVDQKDLQVYKEDGCYIFELDGDKYIHQKIKGYGLNYTKMKLNYKDGLLTFTVPLKRKSERVKVF